MKQRLTELNGEIDKITNIIGDFNTLLSVIDSISSQKQIIKDMDNLSAINQLDLIGINRTL